MTILKSRVLAAALVAACGGDAVGPEAASYGTQEWRITALSFWSLYTSAPPSRTVCEALPPNEATLVFRRSGDSLIGAAAALPIACYSERWDRGVVYSRVDTTSIVGGPITGRFAADSIIIVGPTPEFGDNPWLISGVISQPDGRTDVLNGTFCHVRGVPTPCPTATQVFGGVVAMMRTD